jgi:hypothetical protein
MWEVFKSFIGKLAKSKWNAQSTKVLRKNWRLKKRGYRVHQSVGCSAQRTACTVPSSSNKNGAHLNSWRIAESQFRRPASLAHYSRQQVQKGPKVVGEGRNANRSISWQMGKHKPKIRAFPMSEPLIPDSLDCFIGLAFGVKQVVNSW